MRRRGTGGNENSRQFGCHGKRRRGRRQRRGRRTSSSVKPAKRSNASSLSQNRRQQRWKKISVKQRCAIFFRTSGGTGLPAIAFDKTRDRINVGVFLARIFDVTSALDCVWIPVAAAAHELANMMMSDGSVTLFWGKLFRFLPLEKSFFFSRFAAKEKSFAFWNKFFIHYFHHFITIREIFFSHPLPWNTIGPRFKTINYTPSSREDDDNDFFVDVFSVVSVSDGEKATTTTTTKEKEKFSFVVDKRYQQISSEKRRRN